MTDQQQGEPPEPTAAGRPSGRGARRGPLRVAGVELVGVSGDAGDDLDARQNAAIKDILRWMQQKDQATDQ